MSADPRAAAAKWAAWVRDVERIQKKLGGDLARVESAIQNLEVMTRRFEQPLARNLHGAIEQPVPNGMQQSGHSSVPKTDSDFTADELWSGRRTSAISSGAPPPTNPGGRRFDLVVDETRNRLLIHCGARKEEQHLTISRIPPSLRVILWLAMSRAGAAIKFEEIADLLGWQPIERASRDPRIYQYRLRLKGLLGSDLAQRIFGTGQSAAYPVSESGWSYRWIRRAPEASRSLLLRALPPSLLRSPQNT